MTFHFTESYDPVLSGVRICTVPYISDDVKGGMTCMVIKVMWLLLAQYVY